MNGMIHFYYGDGKGKTTAAVGLAVRAVGYGQKVVFAQFLKTGDTGELKSLEQLGIQVIRSELDLGFTWNMNQRTLEICKQEQSKILDLAIDAVDDATLLVLDEVTDAVSKSLLDAKGLREFLNSKPVNLEVVMTGHAPVDWLMETADYVTKMEKFKHPFDQGVPARQAIEY
jgi:cob(I)alamin adenosyltransferase